MPVSVKWSKPLLAQLGRFFEEFPFSSTGHLAYRLAALGDEVAVAILRVSDAEFTAFEVAAATNVVWAREIQTHLTAECAESCVYRRAVERRSAPGTARQYSGGVVDQTHTLICPIEPSVGRPVGVLVIQRRNPFPREDRDFYRVVGLSISEVLKPTS
jgi:hypothetical protein